METVERAGERFRVCDPSWRVPLETAFSKSTGGRWNVAGEFGALYLNATIAVAAANARRNFEGEIATLYDLLPAQRPDLMIVELSTGSYVDVVSATGLRKLRLPKTYPVGVSHERCRRIAARAYAVSSIDGVACRSNAEATMQTVVGEELAVFDRSLRIVREVRRVPFSRWYPTETNRI